MQHSEPELLVRPAVPGSSFLQYPQYPNLIVPAVPTVLCSTHGYYAVPNCHFWPVQYPQYLQYPAVPTGTAAVLNPRYPQYPAVSTGTVQYPRVLCSTQMHPQYPQYPQYLAAPTGTVQYPNSSTVPTVPAIPCSTHLQYLQYRDCCRTRQGNHYTLISYLLITVSNHYNCTVFYLYYWVSSISIHDLLNDLGHEFRDQ